MGNPKVNPSTLTKKLPSPESQKQEHETKDGLTSIIIGSSSFGVKDSDELLVPNLRRKITFNGAEKKRRDKKTKNYDIPISTSATDRMKADPSSSDIKTMMEDFLATIDEGGYTNDEGLIKGVILKHECLRQVEILFPAFSVMMLEVRRNSLGHYYYSLCCSSVKIDSKKPLFEMTEDEAFILGRAFASSLQGNTLSNTAVGEFVNGSEQLKELEVACPWFRLLMNEIGRELLTTSSWRLLFRVCLWDGRILGLMEVRFIYILMKGKLMMLWLF